MKPDIPVSLIISVYNEETLVRSAVSRALESMAASFDQFEIILIDDGSTDNTGRILQEFARIDSRIRCLDNLVNLNLGQSLKRGFVSARGEIVLFNSIDLPLDCDEIPGLIKIMEDADVLVIERDSYPGATLWRRAISLSNRLFIKSLFPVATKGLWDMNYVQLFRKDHLSRLMPLAGSPTFTPIEMIIRARSLGLGVKRTKTAYHRRHAGKGAFGKPHDILWTIYDALRFRIRG